MATAQHLPMPTLTQGFDFEGTHVRVFDLNGEPAIPQADVCAALGYTDPRVAASKIVSRNPLDFEGCVGATKLVTPSGTQEVNVLTERGVYAMAFLAKTSKAVQFRRAVAMLLEAIRKGKVNVDPLRAMELEVNKLQLELEHRRMNGVAFILKTYGDRVSRTVFDSLVAQVTGQRVHVERTYSSTEMGVTLSGRLNQKIGHVHVGRAATILGIRPPKGQETSYAGWTITKARGSDATVDQVFYKETAVPLFENYFRQNPVKPKKGQAQQQILHLAGTGPVLLGDNGSTAQAVHETAFGAILVRDN